jgi:phosphate transport system substrate-binding protein
MENPTFSSRRNLHVKASRAGILAAAAVSGALVLTACGSDNNTSNSGNSTPSASQAAAQCPSGTLTGAGSTFQQNMQQQWAKDYSTQCSAARINYSGVGSGAGIEQFGNGTVNFAGSDVTMKDAERTKADAICKSAALTLPVTAGGVAIIYNVPGVTDLHLSAPTLAGIFQGTITKWDDAAIAGDNPGAKLPSTPITAFHRSDGSGTTSVFTSFLSAVASSDWKLGSGKEVAWTSGQGKKGSDGVTAGVKQTAGGITYAELSYAKANGLPVASVKGEGSDYVQPTSDEVSKALESFSVTGKDGDLGGTVDYKVTAGYPISTVSYAIVCSTYSDANTAALVKGYLGYAVGAGQQSADSLGYAPLPASLANQVKTSLDGVK